MVATSNWRLSHICKNFETHEKYLNRVEAANASITIPASWSLLGLSWMSKKIVDNEPNGAIATTFP
jgi:hypothetical protein